ncbi:MAG: site-specific integrase [Clostridia bacterium]|nr:site-specific integrase [Eubacterium sp.]MBR3018828.1 site-specific integrase [Clostridia bacterium]
MGDVIQFNASNIRKDYRFAVYEHKLVTKDGLSFIRSFIVLKNRYGVIVRFTRLHNYTGAYSGRTARPLASDANARMHYICMMMNYTLIDNYELYRADHVFNITKEMLVSFFTDYALGTKADGGYRGSESVENCIHSVTLFFSKLIWKFGGHVAMKRAELYKEVHGYDHKGRLVKRAVPDFEIRYVPEEKEIFRDIPTKVFKILMNLALRYAPDIAFAMGLQAFAGLRPGEVCNVRQEGSPKGSGIIFTYLDGRLTRADIDLTHEYAMRSDGVECGKIKKERKQSVYPLFLEAFQQLYECHKDYLASQPFEKDYCPMFVNSSGMAMTYGNYYTRFQYLVDTYLRPLLLEHSDPECRIYGQMLCENKLAPHSLRHWFSVQLALRGEPLDQLQFWRGDRSPESALVYLQNKGELVQELAKTNELLAAFLMDEGALYYGKS